MLDPMAGKEQAVVIDCEGEALCGIVHETSQATETGLILIVGGPQYRVGSHRQFLLLARHLAQHGIPVLRFDYRSMGDSEGAMRDFESIDADIGAALEMMRQRYPNVSKWVLWGLCDAATAASFYAARDPRIVGLVLLNPWVRTEQGQSKAYLKHYYLQRMISADFWRKLCSGKFSWAQSLRALGGNVGRAYSTGNSAGSEKSGALPDRMLTALKVYRGEVLVILSGNDLTAKEFEQAAQESAQWCRLMQEDRVQVRKQPDADHTFSRRVWRDEVAEITTEWVQSL